VVYKHQNRHHVVGGEHHKVVAALDLGTNNCRLLVAQKKGAGYRVVDAFSRVIRLGEGIYSQGMINEEAMERARSAMAACMDKVRKHNVCEVRAVATEACRSAQNGPDFVESLARDYGIPLRIIDAKEEMQLAVRGCGSLIRTDLDRVLLFDIGGGSTELVWLEPGRIATEGMEKAILDWVSLPVGVVGLMDQFAPDGDTDLHTAKRMLGHIRDMFGDFLDRCQLDPVLHQAPRMHLLGTSGTVTTLTGMHLGLDRYVRARVDGTWISANILQRLSHEIFAMDVSARRAIPSVGYERADLLVPGCAIIAGIMERFRGTRVRVADRGLREGMLQEMFAQEGGS
tara:strand:+ start:371 stop:1396 length:1026 start_codon:yes stop_codon:yes gene_type:complete